MATLNTFRNVTANLTTTNTSLYTCNTTLTAAIVLMAQVTNITQTAANVTFVINNVSSSTELVKDFMIPGNDASNVLTGKLVLQNAHSVYASASSNSSLKITMSVLETLI